MDIMCEDLSEYIYNLVPLSDRINISKTSKFFNQLFKEDVSKIIKIQRIFRKNRLSDNYIADANLNKYKSNHYNPNINYNDWNDNLTHRYYMAKYESEYLLKYPEFLTNKAINQLDKKEESLQWINDNLDSDFNKRTRRDIYKFFKENNITSKEILIAGW